MPRFAYNPKVFWLHVGLFVAYVATTAAIDAKIYGQFDWLHLQSGWPLMLMLIFMLIVIDIFFPTLAMRRQVASDDDPPKGIRPLTQSAVWSLALVTMTSLAILLGLPARWFQGYRGSLGGRMQYVAEMAVNPAGRVALVGNPTLTSEEASLVCADQSRVLWSQPAPDRLVQLHWSLDGTRLGMLDRQKNRLTVHDGRAGQVVSAFETRELRRFYWLEGGDILLESESGLARWTPGGSVRSVADDRCIGSVTASPDGRWVWWKAHREEGDRLVRWNAATSRVEASLPAPPHFYEMKLVSDDRALMSFTGRRPVELWSLKEGRCMGSIPGLEFIHHVMPSPDGRWLVGFMHSELQAQVFDVQKMVWVGRLSHLGFGQAMAFNPGGTELWLRSHTTQSVFGWPMAGPIQRWTWPYGN
jgi:hypothetical protein